MQETKILLVDESRRSTDDIKPKLVDLGYVVDQAKSYVELVQLLSTFPIYAVVLVERDLPEEPEGKRKLVGMEIVREISARFPMAQIILFEGGTESSENDIDPVFYKLIDRHLSVSHIIREIQQAQQLTLQRQLETAGIQLHQINKITTALLTSQSKEEIFKTIVNGLASFGFDRIQLYFLSSNGKSLEGVAQYGMQNETEFLKHPWESNYLKELLVKQAQPKPVIYRGDEAKGILDYETKMGRSGLKEWAIFPVAMNGEFMGIIAVDNLYSGRQITQDELAPLIGIASQAVIAIENLELRQREARKSHLMHVIHAVASDINRLVNLQEVYQAVSQAVVDLFDNVDHSGLVIFDNSYRYGKVVSEYPQSMGSKGTVMPIAGIPFGHELLTGAPFVKAEDVERDESLGEVGQTLTSLGIKSILLIPLRHNDRLIGSFGLDSTVRKHTFTQDEIEMAQIFATHVSAAVVNSRRLDEVTALNTIAQAMNRVTKLEDLLELIVSYAVDSVSGRSGGIHLIDYERNIIILMADENRSSSHETILNLDEGMAGYMLINGHAYLVTPNYAEESYASDLFKEKLGYGALIKVRLDHNNSPIGFLYVDDEVGREFSPEDASRLQAFVALAGSAVYQSQLLEKQRNLAKQLEVLHRIGDVIESATDIQIVVDYSLIALTATYALNFDRCAYFLIDSQNPNLLRGKAGYGYFTKIEWEQHAKDLVAKGILDRSSHEKAYVAGELEETPFNQPVREISIDLSSDEAVFLRELLAVEFVWYYPDQRKQFIKQMPRAIQTLFDDEGPAVIVPMAAGGELIGVLIVDNPFSQRTSDSPHLRALKTFVSSTAVAINRLRLFQHEQKQAEQLQSLFEISQQAAKLEDASKTIETIIDKLKEVSGAENVAFIRVNLDHLDPERLYLWAPTTIYSVKPIDAPSEWMRSGGFSVSVLKNGHSKLIDDLALETAADFGYAKGVLNMRAAACLPAITNEKQIGVIWFYFAQTKTFDSQQEIKLWQLFVNQVATLYQLHSDFDKLEAEKRLSEGVQNMVVANDLNGVYDQVVKQVQGVLEKQDKRVSVALYGFDGEQIDITHTACTFGTSSFLEQNITVQQPAELVYRLLSKENMISFSVNPHKKDADEYFESIQWQILLPQENVQAVSLIPIVWEGTHLALLAIGYWFSQPFTNSQTDSLERLARFAAVALHNANELRSKEMEVARFNALLTVNQLARDAETFHDEKLFNFVTFKLFEFMQKQGKKAIFCDLRLRVGNNLVVESVYPFEYKANLRTIDLNQSLDQIGLTGYAFKQGEIIAAYDVHADDRFHFTTIETQSELAVPIKVRDQTIGILNIEFSKINGFNLKDIELIEAFASRVANIMVDSHTLKQRAAFHEASTIVATAITDDVEHQTNQILQQVVEVLKPLNGSHPFLASIQLIDKESGKMYIENIFPKQPFAIWAGRENALHIQTNGSGRIGISGRVQKDSLSRVVGNVHGDLDYIEMNPTTCSQMVVPLREHEKIIGSLSVESEQFNAFMQEDLDMLETFAELVTILLKNGRQYSELLDARTQVESVTALGLMAMITGVWQHANKGRAITIRDRASLLQLDVSDGHLEEVPKHIEVIQDAAKEIATRKIRENLADPSATRPVLINDYLRDYIGRWINIQGHTGIFVRPDVLENEEYLVRIQAEWFSDLLDIIFNNARQVLVGKAVPQITVQSYVDNIKQTYTCMIWDNGPGFPKNELEDLFTKRILKKHNETGSGIGLLMARLIVESFGGRIKGRNHEKGGACITMTFPLAQSKKEEPM